MSIHEARGIFVTWLEFEVCYMPEIRYYKVHKVLNSLEIKLQKQATVNSINKIN